MDEDSLYFEFEFNIMKDTNAIDNLILLKIKNITKIVRS